VTEATGQQLLTSTGVALGTPMYMAPEQAMADPHQDHRVDIYALGRLGYELLTGRAPFSATTAQEMLAAHVTAVPDPVEKYRAAVSPALAQIIMRCLAKKPADRWQTAEEVLQHLEPLATPSGGTTPAQTQSITALGNVPRWGKWAAGVASVALVAVLVSLLLRPKPLSITTFDLTQVTNDQGVEFLPAISPSGDEVAFVAGPIGAPHLYLRSAVNAAGGAAVRLGDTTLGTEWLPAWGADGQSVRFWSCPAAVSAPWDARCSWMETGKLGGAVRAVTLPTLERRVGAGGGVLVAWSADCTRVAFVVGDTVFAASTVDGNVRPVIVEEGGAHTLAWSPGGSRLAYVTGNPYWVARGTSQGAEGGASAWVVDVRGGTPRRISSAGVLTASPVWLDDRHVLFVSDRDGQRAVYGVEVGPQGPRGEHFIVPGLADPHTISYSPRSKRLAYSKFAPRGNIWTYPLGGAAPVSIRDGHPVTTGNQVIRGSDLSPDGKWIVHDGNLRAHFDLYRTPREGGLSTPLTSGPLDVAGPRWSPDGREIVFAAGALRSNGVSTEVIMVMPAEGGPPVALTSDSTYSAMARWSPGGLHVAFQSSRSGAVAVWVVSRDSVGGAWQEAVALGDSACDSPDWAPDGATLACRGGAGGLRFISFPAGRVVNSDLLTRNRLRQLGTPRYSRDGRTIYYFATDPDGRGGIWAIPVAGSRARLLVACDDPALTFLGGLTIGPDRLYLSVGQYESDIWVARLRS
jgi:Tol biopolymer transport system component